MRLAPGDLLILKWLCLDQHPVSSYLVVYVVGDRFGYLHRETESIGEASIASIEEQVEKGEMEAEVSRVA